MIKNKALQKIAALLGLAYDYNKLNKVNLLLPYTHNPELF